MADSNRKTTKSKNFTESWQRSLVKTVTYRVAIIALDFLAVFIFTGKIAVAAGFVLVSNIYTTLAYYGHERIWDRIKWGKTKIKK